MQGHAVTSAPDVLLIRANLDGDLLLESCLHVKLSRGRDAALRHAAATTAMNVDVTTTASASYPAPFTDGVAPAAAAEQYQPAAATNAAAVITQDAAEEGLQPREFPSALPHNAIMAGHGQLHGSLAASSGPAATFITAADSGIEPRASARLPKVRLSGC